MEEKDKEQQELELELEVEKALDEIFKTAKPTELKEEEIEGYSLLEPIIEEGEESFRHLLEELVGEILTIEWEIIPEIAEKAIEKCKKLQQFKLDIPNQRLLKILETILVEVKTPERVTAPKLDLLKKAGDLLYKHNFEQREVGEEVAELEKALKTLEEEVAVPEKEAELPELELELELEEPAREEAPPAPPEVEVPREEEKPPERPLTERPVPEKPIPETPVRASAEPAAEIPDLTRQFLQEYERWVAVEELARLGRKKALRKLILKAKNECREILLRMDPTLEKVLAQKEEEIRNFIAEKEKRPRLPVIREALWCKTPTRVLIIPLEEVAFAGEILSHWRSSLMEGVFPLKLLKGRGLWARFFGKVAPKLQGPLAEKSERELQKMVFKTNKPLTSEKKLILLWKEEQSLALLAEDFKVISLDPDLEWGPADPPFLGKTLLDNTEAYLFSLNQKG